MEAVQGNLLLRKRNDNGQKDDQLAHSGIVVLLASHCPDLAIAAGQLIEFKFTRRLTL